MTKRSKHWMLYYADFLLQCNHSILNENRIEHSLIQLWFISKTSKKQINKMHAEVLKSSWSFEMFGCLNFLYNQDNISYTSASGYKPHCYSCRWSELPSNFPRTKKKKKMATTLLLKNLCITLPSALSLNPQIVSKLIQILWMSQKNLQNKEFSFLG